MTGSRLLGRRTEGETRVLFLAPGDVGKGRVEPISWMQTCNAYAETGLDVTLVALSTRRPDGLPKSELWHHYGVRPTFRLTVVRTTLDRGASKGSSRTWAGLVALWYAVRASLSQLVRPRRIVVHTRLPLSALPFLFSRLLLPPPSRPRVVLETHALPRSSHAWIYRRVDLVVTNSRKLADEIVSLFGIAPRRVLHAPLPPFNKIVPGDKSTARRDLNLPGAASIACYAGKLTELHSEFLLRTAAELARGQPPVRLLIVGGNPEILEWTRRRASELGVLDSVILAGFVDPSRVTHYQAAADVLLYYMPESMSIFPYCTPAKAYEYQAAARPIVATDLPLFDEVFGRDGERALRVLEPTPKAIADTVIKVLAQSDGGRAMSERAAAWVEERTWKRRVGSILEALNE